MAEVAEQKCHQFTTGNTSHRESHPHSKLSLTEQIGIKIIDPTRVFVVGMASVYCVRQLLAGAAWFGQFGEVKEIIFVESVESRQLDSQCFTVVYDNEKSAVAAKRWLISRPHGYDQRKLKAMHGWRRYCQYWLQNKCILSESDCGFLHRWSLPEEQLLSAREKKQFDCKPSGAVTGSFNNVHYQQCLYQQWLYQQAVYEDILQQTIQEQRRKIRALEIRNSVLEEEKEEMHKGKHAQSVESEISGNFMKWDTEEVYRWIIMQIEDGYRYFEGRDKLLAHLKEENVDGSCLPKIEREDLKRFGIRNDRDIKRLINKIQELKSTDDAFLDQPEGLSVPGKP
eukprot:CAMPEP_0197050556 /NCGR_PEP_ID=MMETSP1384-20130603/25418_1 /TAXON_ID=29189 /ORGANISM="Ammonia sp." /LENGTH=339 /DNA_ID=CAMNT_0042482977 /DNA_START=104 /DNA_END=1123 /DNA_ORIENTATION=-